MSDFSKTLFALMLSVFLLKCGVKGPPLPPEEEVLIQEPSEKEQKKSVDNESKSKKK